MRGRSPDGRLHRIARKPDPWAWPDWANAAEDGTFGNRWDDPSSIYRVLYAASDRLGAFIEVLARFRPDPHVTHGLSQIVGDESSGLPPGSVPASWLDRRVVGESDIAGDFADVGASESLAAIRRDLASRLIHYEIPDVDGSAIRLKAPRRLTQEISRYVYELTKQDGRRAFSGITYLSRLGDEFRNWAVFEPSIEAEALAVAANPAISAIPTEDPDLQRALTAHGLTLVWS